MSVKNFEPWHTDATHWTSDDFAKLKPSGEPEILKFAEANISARGFSADDQSKNILVGRRGLGKSFLLAYRSFKHRQLAKNTIFFHPSGGTPPRLVERLTSLSGGLADNHWLRGPDGISGWPQIWQTAILGLLVWQLDDDPKQVQDFSACFPGFETLTAAYRKVSGKDESTPAAPLQWFLGAIAERVDANRNRGLQQLDRMLYAATRYWGVNIQGHLRNMNRSGIAVYLDNPDELVRVEENALWSNVQQGLVIAAWKLHKGDVLANQLRVFFPVRTEAVSPIDPAHILHSDLQPALSGAINLHYSAESLKELFRHQITLMEDEDLYAPEERKGNLVRALLGWDTYMHDDRTQSAGLAPLYEPVLDALVRHSRMIPRDLIAFGASISSIPRDSRNMRSIKAAVNSASGNLVQYLKKNASPPWTGRLDQLIKELDSEVVAGETMTKIVDRILKTGGRGARKAIHPVKHLYTLGLLGYADPQPHTDQYIQRFSYDDPVSNNASVNLTRNFFFVHPALKEYARADQGGAWKKPKSDVLIGNGLPYEPAPPEIRLLIINSRLTFLRANKPLPATAARSRVAPTMQDQIMFLALWAWKTWGSEGDGYVDGSKLQVVLNAIRKVHPNMKLARFGASTLNTKKLLATLQQKQNKPNKFDSGFVSVSDIVGERPKFRLAISPKNIWIDRSSWIEVRGQ